MQPHTPEVTPAPAGCLLRLFWMIGANAVIYASLATIAMKSHAFPSTLDVVVWVTVALSLIARRLDITRWDGKTAAGERATLTHWRRYAVAVIMITAAASALAHAIGGG